MKHHYSFRRLALALSAFLGFCTPGFAQYNNAYSSSINYGLFNISISGTARDIVDADPGNQCVLSILTDLPYTTYQTPSDNLISLKKIDFNGNPIWNHTFQLSDSFYKLDPRRLIQTDDQGFLIVGRAFHKTVNPVTQAVLSNPFAFKVDMNGTFQWADIYRSNFFAYPDSVQTSVVRVTDDTVESYMIVRSASALNTYQHPQDVLINVVKINGSGTAMFNKKYICNGRSGIDSAIRDFPATVAYVPDTAGDFYFISGTRDRYTSYYGKDSSLFYLGINRNGSIVRGYHYAAVPAMPYGQDAIYDDDASEQSIVLSYTLGKSRLNTKGSSTHSQVAVMKFDHSLGIKMFDYYWSTDEAENQAIRIKRTPANDAYVIGCNVQGADSAAVPHMALLKIDKSGSPLFYEHYNYLRRSKAFSLLAFTDQGQTTEYYGLVGERISGNGHNVDIKTLATDSYGLTCGARSLNVSDSAYADTASALDYSPRDSNVYYQVSLAEVFPDQAEDQCDPNSGDYFRNSRPVSQVAANAGIRVYPTITGAGQDAVRIDVSTFASDAAPVQLVLSTVDGRKLEDASLQSVPGAAVRHYSWRMPEVAAGVYLLSVETGSGHKVFRMVRQ